MIKLIAVDMDGTFLNGDMDYNRPQFAELYEQMKQQGIKFVVASGNQYYQLRSFFPDIHHEIAFVSENGANVVSELNDVWHAKISRDVSDHVHAVLRDYPDGDILVCGKKSAYIHTSQTQDYYESALNYYHKLAWIEDYDAIEDDLLKFALLFPQDQVEAVVKQLTTELQGKIIPVSSGNRAVDLILPGVHKANGLAILGALWDIKPEEMVAFGDGGNDVEMLAYVGRGYAMANAQDRTKAVADEIIASNRENGVLDTIAHILANNME